MEHQGHDTTEIIGKIRVERRKAQKPRIEKLRRDRINGSLDEIKHLVLEALNKDISRYSKMEKADILEMAVQFLKETQARKRMQRVRVGTSAQGYKTSGLSSDRPIRLFRHFDCIISCPWLPPLTKAIVVTIHGALWWNVEDKE
ncbi:transcription factor HES-1-like isoform X2 [Stylophora pistillata]|uniref:transcription factor HES-1-like isoform X2 n=1 Tax=Stylophora pistillata TaxID=50429 RepID=UPI000C054F7A|nr:transcription factor HES-1-like isoform X2 [Stylophora pistillata]